MSEFATEYHRQFQWRAWDTILDALPPLEGKVVLDLGCGIGDISAQLAARGARVLGFDGNEELLNYARSRQIPNVAFRTADLRTNVDLGLVADGIWCSFTAAFLTDFQNTVAHWSRFLQPGGWIAVTEIDDMFGHEPLTPTTAARLKAYCDQGLSAARYDFWSGRKLSSHLEKSGFSVLKVRTIPDRELSFQGPAEPDVLEAWRNRFLRMKLLHEYLGSDFACIMQEFLDCLGHPDHRSNARVFLCLALKPPDTAGRVGE